MCIYVLMVIKVSCIESVLEFTQGREQMLSLLRNSEGVSERMIVV
jgi:hypothetical protein